MIYYLVGIKGSAMAGLAKLLHSMNEEVRGVDYEGDFYTIKDISKDIVIETFNNVEINNEMFFIIGNAFTTHPLTNYIVHAYDNYDYYPHFIDSFLNLDKIAISGTHGKTTTTKIIADILDKRCAFLVGDGSGHYDKAAEYFVFEACEYKNTFLNYHPQVLIINNIDYDHPDFYQSIEDVFRSFNEASSQSEVVIYNGDDKYASKVDALNKLSFGLSLDNDVCGEYTFDNNQTQLNVRYSGYIEHFVLPFVGKHMVYNFLAAYTCLKYLKVSNEEIQNRINSFVFPKRRLEIHEDEENIIVCDYAHHPNEIKVLFETIKLKYPEYTSVLIFQPHTNSRSIRFKQDFKRVIDLFDEAYLVDIFTSVREKSDGTNDLFMEWINKPIYDEKIQIGLKKSQKKVICFTGAGSIDLLAEAFLGIDNK